jgi:hypothetical protein
MQAEPKRAPRRLVDQFLDAVAVGMPVVNVIRAGEERCGAAVRDMMHGHGEDLRQKDS